MTTTVGASLGPRFSPEELARLRRALGARGQVIATKLTELLAGADGEAVARALGFGLAPGARPEEILRRSLDHVVALRALIDADDDHYGRCATCQLDLGPARMLEVPWADACPAHA
jgi:hypothetical protein